MRDTAVVRDTRYMPLEWAVGLRTLDCMSFGSTNCEETAIENSVPTCQEADALGGSTAAGDPVSRDRSGTGNSSRRRQVCRGRSLLEGSASTINPWRWRQGVQPNMHHLLALQDLADSMDLGHLLARVRVRN